MKKGEKITGADANFYLHEISESKSMSKGFDYDMAHNMALRVCKKITCTVLYRFPIEKIPAGRQKQVSVYSKKPDFFEKSGFSEKNYISDQWRTGITARKP